MNAGRVLRYVGSRTAEGFEVIVNRERLSYPLDARNDLANHSPTGVSWGYGGSGPAQLALAILADYLDDDARALALYQSFKWATIARLPMELGFDLTPLEIENAIAHIEFENMRRSG